jgi:hypothetical protein
VERLVVVWCPSLSGEDDRGDVARTFDRLLGAAAELCPWVEPVRLGVCALPARGPRRFFGGEEAVVDRLTAALVPVLQAPGDRDGDRDGDAVRVGVADGLFAGLLAARSRLIVPAGTAAAFLAPLAVEVLQRPDLAATLHRLGIHTLGRLAALPERDVSARFGADAALCHRVACGATGELAGLRDPGIGRRLRAVRGVATDGVDQPGFFGGASAADERAGAAFFRVERRLGAGAVVLGRLQGGRAPAERARLVPWDRRDAPGAGADPHATLLAPWPGRLPAPSPVTVLDPPRRAELVDAAGRALRVTGRGLLNAAPARLSVEGDVWQEVRSWAGPWPASERWWAGRHRRARLQALTGDGDAVLLSVERGRWWLEASYE